MVNKRLWPVDRAFERNYIGFCMNGPIVNSFLM